MPELELPPAPRQPRRLVYLGTPDFAVRPLQALVDAGFDVALVVSRPDARRGRGGRVTASPVKAAALDLGIPVSDDIDDVLSVGADLGVVVAYGRLIRANVLAELPLVNIHFSLLPRWRGAAPVERAVLAGDARTGVDLMVVEEGLDTGAVYARAGLPIGPDDTVDTLQTELAELGASLLVENLRDGLPEPTPQSGEPTYAHKIDPAELQIDWSQPPEAIHRLVRVGGAWTTFRGKRLKLWRTALTDDGTLRLVEVQPEGKPRMPADAWANGAHWDGQEPLGS
jgi:methionyl-tRNA formyltransferase